MEPSAQPAVLKTAGVLDKDAFSGGAASVRAHIPVQQQTLTKLMANIVILVYILNGVLCLWCI